MEVVVLSVAAKVVLVTGLDQSKAVPDSQLEPIIQLFSTVVTVMVK